MHRIQKIDPETLSGETRRIFDRWSPGGKPLNIVLIYFRNAELNRNWSYMATHLFMKNSLSDRQREIVVLRTSWQCASDYEFIQHVRIAREGKLLSEEEIYALTQPEVPAGWPAEERALATAADELLAWNTVGDQTWSVLARHFDIKQLMDIVATAGGYALNSMATSSFGVDIEDNMEREDGLVPSWHSPAFRFLERTSIGEIPEVPRVATVQRQEIDADTLNRIEPWLEGAHRTGLLMTMARHPVLIRGWSSMLGYVDNSNSLNAQDRLTIALRAASRCGCKAEMVDRLRLAEHAGLSVEDQAALTNDYSGSHDNSRHGLLLRAVDELIEDMVISDEHWQTLGRQYGEEQIMDIVFATATELMICWMQNALAISAEPS